MLFKLPELAAAQESKDAKDTLGERREGALKFMTRSVALMADGKGECGTRAQIQSLDRREMARVVIIERSLRCRYERNGADRMIRRSRLYSR